MNRLETPSPSLQDCPDGVNFLTSLLMQFHEIGAVELTLARQEVRIYFYSHLLPNSASWQSLETLLQRSWKAFFLLQKLTPTICQFDQAKPLRASSARLSYTQDIDESLDDIESFCVVRDITSLTPEEICLISSLVRESLSDALCGFETFDSPSHFDPEEQQERLAVSLQRIRNQKQAIVLRAMRDENRILIYADGGNE
jgi:hypothetical protein